MLARLQSLVKRFGRDILRPLLWRVGINVDGITPEERVAFEGFQRQLSGRKFATTSSADAARLLDLRTRYASVNLPIAAHSIWRTTRTSDTYTRFAQIGVDLRAFRGHSAYVWSYAGSDPRVAKMKYFIFANAVRQKDSAGLFGRLCEDDAFGSIGFDFPGMGLVSRDLLDSIREINFLHKHLNVLGCDDLRVLDIGAGYGRMAHRMLEANPQIKSYACVDAVPESTYLCELYLKYRKLQDRVRVIALDEVEDKLVSAQFDLALNIHSFSECPYAAIEWWLTRLRTMNVRHLFIVPNQAIGFLSLEPNGDQRDYAPLLNALGYELVAREPVFDDPAVEELMAVRDSLYLFERDPRPASRARRGARTDPALGAVARSIAQTDQSRKISYLY